MSELFEFKESEGSDEPEARPYRVNFRDLDIKLCKNNKSAPHRFASDPSDPSDMVPDAFLKEWFGLHAGREVFRSDIGDRVFFSGVEDLVAYMKTCNRDGYPAWMSVQPYRERDIVFGLEKLFFDFDSKADPPDLEKAWVDAHDFSCKLQKYYGIMSLVVFSGRRGFHLYVFLWSTVEFHVHRQEVAKEVYAKLQEKLLKGLLYETLDRQVTGDIKRLARIPYSVHEKTGQTCQPLTLERQPLWLGPGGLHEYRRYGIQRGFFEKVCKEVVSSNAKKDMKRRREFKSHQAGNKNVRPCINAALSNPDLPHLMRLAIAVEHLHVGLPITEIADLFRDQADFDEKKTRYQVEHAAQRGYKPRKCNTILSYGFCLHEGCPVFKRRKGAEA